MAEEINWEMALAEREAIILINAFDKPTKDHVIALMDKYRGDWAKLERLVLALANIAHGLGIRLEIASKKPLEEILRDLESKLEERDAKRIRDSREEGTDDDEENHLGAG